MPMNEIDAIERCLLDRFALAFVFALSKRLMNAGTLSKKKYFVVKSAISHI
jgi:hypothetical protein